jgi:glycosyltransferase involved in cell wall biosynthesis
MSSGRIRIWYLIGSLQVGGANRTLVDLANNLDHERFDVTIWTLLRHNPLADDLVPAVEFRCLGASGKTDILTVFRLLRVVRRERPDILQSFLFFDNTLARVAGALSPETTVISGVRSVPESPDRLRDVVDRLTMPLADYVVSNSEAGRELAIRRGADPDSVSVIENGRDLSAYQEATAPPELRSELGVPSDARLVGTVGRLIERKGGYDLLEAWPDVMSEHSDAQLLFVGDGPEREGLERAAERHGVADSVTFVGTREDVPELLDAMDVFVFPSHFEGLPGALIEAMAVGLPIVATECTGNAELLSDGTTATLVPIRDSSTLAEHLEMVLSDEQLRSRMGAHAKRVSTDRYAVKTMVNQFVDLYDNAISS